MKSLAAVAGMLATLALTRWFDYLYDVLRTAPTRNVFVGTDAILWLGAATDVIVAGLLLLLTWFVMVKNGGSRFVFVSFLLVGILLLFSFSLQASLSLLPPSMWQLFTAVMPTSPRSLLFHAGAFIAVIGLMGLVVRRRP